MVTGEEGRGRVEVRVSLVVDMVGEGAWFRLGWRWSGRSS